MRPIVVVFAAAAVAATGLADTAAAQECALTRTCPKPAPRPDKPKPSLPSRPAPLPPGLPKVETVAQYQTRFSPTQPWKIFSPGEIAYSDGAAIKNLYLKRLKDNGFVPNISYYTHVNGRIFGGLDVVESSAKGRLIEGSVAFSLAWNGAVWSFVSSENMEKFLAEPRKYDLPFGGYCASCAAQGHLSMGAREHFSIRGGKILFFATKWHRDGFVEGVSDSQLSVKLERAQTRWLGLPMSVFPKFTADQISW